MKNYLKTAVLFLLIVLISGCASTKPVHKPAPKNPAEAKKAENYYLSGALYDFQDQYEKALLEYYQALLYDSTSAQILKAIGRDLIRTQRFESAKEYLQRSLRYNPEDKETLYYIAEAYINLKDYENSVVYLERLWHLAPFNSAVERNLIDIYTFLGQDEKLMRFYEKLLDIHGYGDHISYNLFSLYLKEKQVDKAQKLLEEIIKENPNSSGNWVLLGNIKEMQKDTTGAIEAYKKALFSDLGNSKAMYQLYQIYRSSNNWQGLVETFREVIRQSPANPDARLILAEGLYHEEEFDSSIAILNPLLGQEEYQVQAYRLMGMISSEQKRYGEAEDFFKKITQIEPENKFGWLSLAFLYNQQEKFNQSIVVLQDALSILPTEVDLLSVYGSTLNQLGRFDEALNVLSKAYRINPKNLNVIISLGVVYEELKMYEESDSLNEAALKLYPNEALLLNNYSYSLSERGFQLDRALQMAEKAIELDPDNGAYLDTIGWIHFKLGNYEKARDYILKAVEQREDSAVVVEHLGDVYFKLGDLNNALKYWHRALEKDSENIELKNKIENNEI